MKKILAVFLLIAILTSLGIGASAEEPALTKDIVVLFTSDVHCGIESGFGYTGLAAIRDQLAKTNHVLLVDNGDAIQGEALGTLTNGEAIVKLMNTLKYDVAIPGNHEFDYGMERFLYLAQKVAKYPYVCVNLSHEGEPIFPPYVIKELDGVKVAFVGVATPTTITTSTPSNFQDASGKLLYDFCGGSTGDALYTAVQKAVDDARAEGADYVIVQAHLGIEAAASPWTSTELIENTTGIDAVLDGHSHSELQQELVKNKENKEVLLSACGTKLADIGYLRITTDGKLSTGLYTWKYDISFPGLLGNTKVGTAVSASLKTLGTQLKKVVASSDVPLTILDPETGVRIVRSAETNLGDLCSDAVRAAMGADVGLFNGGGVRDSIPAGKITLNDILKVHPFGNGVSMVEATGQQILDALEWSSRSVPSENGGFLQVSGMTYEIHTYIESSVKADDKGGFAGVDGEYRVKNVMIGGEPLELDKTYTVAATGYILKSGGDGNNLFMNCKLLADEAILDNQALIQYITKDLNGIVGEAYSNPYGEGRIVAVAEEP